ncbi:anti-sigma factor domain-containing protein [Streptosporangium sp. NPDC000396]|uniref:anti-sigma factor n=1 Tax=Streptosporangium sp. NPDC000396 TaxID=3366185 RepID=UPI003680806E
MNEDLHTLSGAYVLHALPEREVALFEDHMARCEACAVEVRGLSETAARLAAGAAETPPASLRARVMERIAEVRQEPPLVERSAEPPPGDVVRLRPRSPWRGRVATGLVAVASAAAVFLGVVAVDAVRERDALQRVVAVIAAPDAKTVRRPVSSGGTGTIVMSRAEGRMVFTARGLPALPGSRVYQLWLMGSGGVRPAGLLERTSGGVTAPVLATPLEGDDRVGLTVEPEGGSEQPTTTPVMVARIPSA